VTAVSGPLDGSGKELSAVGVATYDDRTFYVLYSENNPASLGSNGKGNGELLIYRLTLSARGKLTGLAPVGAG
jgi:hypothetical protein